METSKTQSGARITCPCCKKQFRPKRSNVKYCSKQCYRRNNSAKHYEKLKQAKPPKPRREYTPAEQRRRTCEFGARALGISVQEYSAHYDAGERHCAGCNTWHAKDEFSTRTYCRKVKNEREQARRDAKREQERIEKAQRARLAKYRYRHGVVGVASEPAALPSWVNRIF